MIFQYISKSPEDLLIFPFDFKSSGNVKTGCKAWKQCLNVSSQGSNLQKYADCMLFEQLGMLSRLKLWIPTLYLGRWMSPLLNRIILLKILKLKH